jgi:hypothetical protein
MSESTMRLNDLGNKIPGDAGRPDWGGDLGILVGDQFEARQTPGLIWHLHTIREHSQRVNPLLNAPTC